MEMASVCGSAGVERMVFGKLGSLLGVAIMDELV